MTPNYPREKERGSKSFSAADKISIEKLQRLTDWNVELFEDLLRPILLHKKRKKDGGGRVNFPNVNETILPDGTSFRNQVVAAVRMADFQSNTSTKELDLDPVVVSQLLMHITTVANLYGNNNAFHNFESPLMLSCLQ
jgi:hypothetical protein